MAGLLWLEEEPQRQDKIAETGILVAGPGQCCLLATDVLGELEPNARCCPEERGVAAGKCWRI